MCLLDKSKGTFIAEKVSRCLSIIYPAELHRLVNMGRHFENIISHFTWWLIYELYKPNRKTLLKDISSGKSKRRYSLKHRKKCLSRKCIRAQICVPILYYNSFCLQYITNRRYSRNRIYAGHSLAVCQVSSKCVFNPRHKKGLTAVCVCLSVCGTIALKRVNRSECNGQIERQLLS